MRHCLLNTNGRTVSKWLLCVFVAVFQFETFSCKHPLEQPENAHSFDTRVIKIFSIGPGGRNDEALEIDGDRSMLGNPANDPIRAKREDLARADSVVVFYGGPNTLSDSSRALVAEIFDIRRTAKKPVYFIPSYIEEADELNHGEVHHDDVQCCFVVAQGAEEYFFTEGRQHKGIGELVAFLRNSGIERVAVIRGQSDSRRTQQLDDALRNAGIGQSNVFSEYHFNPRPTRMLFGTPPDSPQ